MKQIDLNNYEEFILDYLEGKLDEEGQAQLRFFAIANPELQIELDSELPYLEPDQLMSDFKGTLKKSPTSETEILDFLENQLPDDEKKLFQEKINADIFLQKEVGQFRKTFLMPEPVDSTIKYNLYKTADDLMFPDSALEHFESGRGFSTAMGLPFKKDLELLEKTRLIPENIIFPDKRLLKKKNRVILLFNTRTISAAAAVLLLIGLIYIFRSAANQAPVELAVQPENRKIQKVKQDLSNKINPVRKDKSLEDTVIASEKVVIPHGEKLVAEEKDNSSEERLPVVANEVQYNQTLTDSNLTVLQSTVMPENKNVTEDSPVYLAFVEEITEEDEEVVEEKRDGFWERAIHVARQANKLGVTSIDGEETKNRLRLSFNSFSVEKK